MSFSIARRRLLLTGAAAGAASGALAQGRDGDSAEISKHETATIDGRRWDTPLPGSMTTTRDGLTLKADGTVGLLRVEYRPWSKEIDITHSPKADQIGDSMDRNFLISGLAEAPRVTVNGRAVDAARAGRDFQIALASL